MVGQQNIRCILHILNMNLFYHCWGNVREETQPCLIVFIENNYLLKLNHWIDFLVRSIGVFCFHAVWVHTLFMRRKKQYQCAGSVPDILCLHDESCFKDELAADPKMYMDMERIEQFPSPVMLTWRLVYVNGLLLLSIFYLMCNMINVEDNCRWHICLRASKMASRCPNVYNTIWLMKGNSSSAIEVSRIFLTRKVNGQHSQDFSGKNRKTR